MTPRMRTAEGALAIIKEQDPDIAVTLRYIRRLITDGTIPHHYFGSVPPCPKHEAVV